MSDENTNEDAGEQQNYNQSENTGENPTENSVENTVESPKTEETAAASATSAVKLDIGDTFSEGIAFTLNNIGPILVNALLWVLTIWIPYLNVGTTIGMFTGIVAKISRGEPISYTEVFNPIYRKFMGDYFITLGLVFSGVFIGVLFLIVPGFIVALAWGFALILVVDKGKNPIEAISLSNKITYGNKGMMFLISILINMFFSILQGVLSFFDNNFATFLLVIIIIIQFFLSLGIQASIYKQLSKDV